MGTQSLTRTLQMRGSSWSTGQRTIRTRMTSRRMPVFARTLNFSMATEVGMAAPHALPLQCTDCRASITVGLLWRSDVPHQLTPRMRGLVQDVMGAGFLWLSPLVL